jgi:serine/threonine protein phosphatase PrpC
MSHRYAGTPRQDSFCVAADENQLVVAIADGVSQGPYSHIAAEVAARASCKLALEARASSEPDWTDLSGRVSRRILDEARYRRLVGEPVGSVAEQVREVRDLMSTTLVVATISRKPDSSGGFPTTVAVVAGDSSAYSLEAGHFDLVGGGKEEGKDEITTTAVRPLPGPVEPRLEACVLAPSAALFLMSDGVGDPLNDGTGDLADTLAERWVSPPAAAEFFLHTNFLRRTFDDDRTVLGVWVLPED